MHTHTLIRTRTYTHTHTHPHNTHTIQYAICTHTHTPSYARTNAHTHTHPHKHTGDTNLEPPKRIVADGVLSKEEPLSLGGRIQHVLRRQTLGLGDVAQLVVLAAAGVKGPPEEEFGHHAAQGPHVNALGERQAQQDLGSSAAKKGRGVMRDGVREADLGERCEERVGAVKTLVFA